MSNMSGKTLAELEKIVSDASWKVKQSKRFIQELRCEHGPGVSVDVGGVVQVQLTHFDNRSGKLSVCKGSESLLAEVIKQVEADLFKRKSAHEGACFYLKQKVKEITSDPV